jgi:steroid delta-isomerase-like uncharacterized protein
VGAAENAATVRQWIDAYNSRDQDAEAAARAPGFLVHVPGAPAPLDSEGWIAFAFGFAQAFPDLHLTIEDIFATDDRVAARITFRGTHRGPFQGIPPTERPVTFTAIEFNRMEGGKVAEHWVELDVLGLMTQLGANPAPEPAGTEIRP